jgi:hypothetical protein
MILRVLPSSASLLCLLHCAASAWAQGTIQFGFEEYSIGSTPPFVTQLVPSLTTKGVFDSSTVTIPSFEGQRFFFTSGLMRLTSPDRLPIQSFAMHVFVIPPPPSVNLFFSVSGERVQQFGSWQTVQGTFSSPIPNLEITAVDSLNQYFGSYAIDAIELTTVPEPQTFWLLTLGLSAILLRRSKSLETQSR